MGAWQGHVLPSIAGQVAGILVLEEPNAAVFARCIWPAELGTL